MKKKTKKLSFPRMITFTKDTKRFLLKTFGFRVGRDGYIYAGRKKALASDGKPILANEFVGFTQGKNKETVLHRNDIFGIMEIADKI